MKFALYEILPAMADYQNFHVLDANLGIDSAKLSKWLEDWFKVPVTDEGTFEATFVTFCNEYCG